MRRAASGLVLLGLTLARVAVCQTPPDPNQTAAALAAGQKALGDRDWAAASSSFENALAMSRERHDERSEAWSLNGLASVAYHKAQYRESRDLNLKALGIFERLEDWTSISAVERSLGNAASYLTDPNEAKRWYREAMTAADRVGDRVGHARSLFDLLRLDDSQEGLDLMPGLLQDVRALDDRLFEAQVLHSWGDHLFNRDAYEGAIEKIGQAAHLYEELGRRNELSTAFNSLGRVFRMHGQPAVALRYQLKALAIQRSLDDPRNRIQCLNAVAVTYQALGDWRRARDYYEQAIALAGQVGWTSIIPRLQGNLGDLLIKQGDVRRGRALVEQSLGDPETRTSRLLELSEADFLLVRYDRSLALAQQVLDRCPEERPTTCIAARVRRAEAELALGRREEASAESAAALDALEAMHGKLAASDFLKQGFAAEWTQTYTLAIDVRFRGGDLAGALAGC